MNRVLALTIVLLVGAVAWLGTAVVRLENYRYANSVGMCSKFGRDDPMQRVQRDICLDQIETRANSVWHLIYGLRIL